ncbi:acyl-CoA dehydrogenase NM domain-like protein [Abortiporus biennis]|nr:acyl-CoA dehydrogenase NM domain-like protein [Abortiporus biennis]
MSCRELHATLPVLASHPVTLQTYFSSDGERALQSYQRAEAAALTYGLTLHDIVTLSPKFWQLHQDPMVAVDASAFTIIVIQYNLAAGTISTFAKDRPDLLPLIDDLLQWRKLGQFLLTEVGHGIDMSNIETTATRLPNGEFILNTPTRRAAKFMPPAIPVGKPAIGIVLARLIVDQEDRGIRPFVVPLNDGREMCQGVTARLLPQRGGTHPVNHSVATFNNVRLAPNSLLGSLEKPKSPRDLMAKNTWRVAIGSMALACLSIPFMQVVAFIGARYSMRRVVGPEGNQKPILQFRTQQIPILTTVAQVYVIKSLAKWGADYMTDTKLDARVRHGIASTMKAVMTTHCLTAAQQVGDRCGAQGLFEHNQINVIYGAMKGISIAEGDVLALSIRLATELLQGRYSLPSANDPSSYLARHEAGLFTENRNLLKTIANHRSEEVNKLIIPQCLPLIQAIGHRMAYEAAVADKLPWFILDLYAASVIKLDAAWYVENLQLSRRGIIELESKAMDAMLPRLGDLVRDMNVEEYVLAPIVTEEKWDTFVESLPLYTGSAEVPLWDADGRRNIV